MEGRGVEEGGQAVFLITFLLIMSGNTLFLIRQVIFMSVTYQDLYFVEEMGFLFYTKENGPLSFF